jgi:hypothetical protein
MRQDIDSIGVPQQERFSIGIDGLHLMLGGGLRGESRGAAYS